MTDEPKIKKGLPPKRNPVCFQTQNDIVIPAGTMLRDPHGTGTFSCTVATGHGAKADFSIENSTDPAFQVMFKRVVAA